MDARVCDGACDAVRWRRRTFLQQTGFLVASIATLPIAGVEAFLQRGINGAGPLLHRAVLETAKRYPPGAFATPREVGAVTAKICRLSGMRAGPDCPTASEWFIPGSEPTAECDWHEHGGVSMPAAYADWVAAERGAGANVRARISAAPNGFRIVSPLDGDRYSVPPSVDPRYSTVALRTAGAKGAVRWIVDGKTVAAPRLTLVPGIHVIRAESGADAREVRIVVEGADGAR